MDLLGLKLPVL